MSIFSNLEELPKEILIVISTFLDKSSKISFLFSCSYFLKNVKIKKIPKHLLMKQIVDDNHFSLLTWAKNLGCGFDTILNDYCKIAAKNDNFEMLKWLKENECPWNANTCSFAAYVGNFEMLKWLKENDCPWDENSCC